MPTEPELLATFGDEPVLSRFGVSVGVAFERLIGIAVPAVVIASTGSYVAAILMGALTPAITAVGRARFTTNSRVVHATRDHLEIVTTDGSTKSVSWERVVAIECWRSIDSRTDLSIHVSTDVGLGQDVFRVWARESADTLRKFLECCAERVPFREGRIGPLASLQDRATREPLLRRLFADFGLAAIAVFCASLYAHQSLLRATLMSPVTALAYPAISLLIVALLRVAPKRIAFERSADGWLERRGNLEQPCTELPRGLRLWGNALLRSHPVDSARAAYR